MGLFFAMKIQLITSKNQRTSEWSGGTTTQLYIYPESADFSKRDFAYRISSAKVEIDESTFTPFPNYNRKLMVLEGVLELYHEDQYAVQLHPFDQDAFPGDWISRSKGKAHASVTPWQSRPARDRPCACRPATTPFCRWRW